MTKKVFSLNNSGTEAQSILGYLEQKENIIIIENTEIHSFVSTIDTAMQLEDFGVDEEHNDDTLMATDLLDQSSDSINDFNLNQFVTENDSEFEHNEKIVSKIFQNLSNQKFDMVLNIPPNYVKSVFINDSFTNIKGSKKDTFIKKEVNNKLDRPINESNFDYLNTIDNKILAFTYEGLPPLFNVYDKVKDRLKIKPKIKMILPIELSLTNLIHFNYSPEEDEVIAIVHITTEMSKIILTKGGRILHISQPISENANSPALLSKISGRLLFEKDVSSIHHFSRIVISGERDEKDVVDFMKQQFSENEIIEYFDINKDKFKTNQEFINEDMSKLASALGLLTSSLLYNDHHENYIDLVPNYIKNKQVFFKLSWYNITLLILLAITPIYLSSLLARKKVEYNEWKQKTEIISEKLALIEYVEQKRDSLNSELINIMDELGRIKGISKGAVQFSETINLINNEINKLGGIWLENLDYSQQKIVLSGYSKYRGRITKLVAFFEKAEIKTINPKDIRGFTVYEFEIIINKLVKNESIFDPKIIEPNKG